ncbi:asparagine synthase C-terminal domain-containing protein [Halomicrococcus sp. NG-SE-24]|uniref:asparagine synthase C-terminal domain-containing protein n=1 Tax=Halomicrococcus sp. NG-SE-24 TaxID=3436928 RepID=UPI003D97FA8F
MAGESGLSGAEVELVRRAVDAGDPLPGTRGFAGRLLDGRLVRDVLGRVPLFSEADDATAWSHDPTDLDAPDPVPAGHARVPASDANDGAARDERLWNLPDPPPVDDRREAVDAVRTAVDASLSDAPADGTAVAFSGGVDSALVAAALDRPCYVAGFPESHDVTAAREAAAMLDCDLTVVELDHDAVERAVPAVARATGRTNAMDVEIALPLFLVAERVAADGHDRLAVGQGADELFGGYDKVARADHRVAADTVRGAARETVRSLAEQLPRDALAVRAGGVEPVAPLLDDRVVAAALRLPGELLVSECGERKWALRLAAREFVPDRVAFREKKAVQYGSLVARELDRLARQAGFKRRRDDHVTSYVESRVRAERASRD